MELGQGRVRLGVRKRFCTQRVVGHWDRLPRAVVTALSLMKFKKCLDNVLRIGSDFWVALWGPRSWTQ